MSLFEVYVRLEECVAENIILHRSMKWPGLMRGNKIYVNGNDSEDRQIQTLLPEVVHDIPIFKGKSRAWNHDPVIEDQIEKYAKEIYDCCKLVVGYVGEQLRKAKTCDGNWMG